LKLAIYLKRNLKHSRPGEYIFDVGANKGSMSKIFARLYQNTKIFAFEPLPIFQVKSSRINLNQVALGAHIGTAQFYVCKHNASSSLILPYLESRWLRKKAKILGSSPKDLYEEIQIQLTTIDKVVNDNSIKSIFILKIDTEGSELDVIDGARESLRTGIIRNIQVESHDNDLRKSQKLEIFNLLASYNYVHKKSIKHFFGNFTEEIFSKIYTLG
jgi:FkbM family methyltransferase